MHHVIPFLMNAISCAALLCVYSSLQCIDLEFEINLRDGEAIMAAAQIILLLDCSFSVETRLHLSNLSSLVRQHAMCKTLNQSFISCLVTQREFVASYG